MLDLRLEGLLGGWEMRVATQIHNVVHRGSPHPPTTHATPTVREAETTKTKMQCHIQLSDTYSDTFSVAFNCLGGKCRNTRQATMAFPAMQLQYRHGRMLPNPPPPPGSNNTQSTDGRNVVNTFRKHRRTKQGKLMNSEPTPKADCEHGDVNMK